jgi:hypothetical protein
MANLLSCEGDRGIDLIERQVAAAEVGVAAVDAEGAIVAIVRDGTPMAPADPRLGALAAGDRLVLSAPPARGPAAR